MDKSETTGEGNKIIKYALLKKKNRRITVFVTQNNEGKIAVLIQTARLIDFKSRHILRANVCYGAESFIVIAEIFDLLNNDPEFLKAINPESGIKEKMTLLTNIQTPKIISSKKDNS